MKEVSVDADVETDGPIPGVNSMLSFGEWNPVLRREINGPELFWLFWSRNATASEWVEWEWRTAYMEKGKNSIQPHPLEPADIAPPPKELEDLQFGTAYETYLHGLRSRRPSRYLNPLKVIVKRMFSLGH